MSWSEADVPDQHGRVAVVTGGNAGLGLATATVLAPVKRLICHILRLPAQRPGPLAGRTARLAAAVNPDCGRSEPAREGW